MDIKKSQKSKVPAIKHGGSAKFATIRGESAKQCGGNFGGKSQKFRNKNILITAGPTAVPIDSVRVISNIATGKTGIMLAEALDRLGAKVTLVLGPSEEILSGKKIKIIRFRFFDELRSKLKKELEARPYDFIIHSAAISDFRPWRLARGKLKSNGIHNLKLIPLPKVTDDIRHLCPSAKLVIFKLESKVSKNSLIKRSRITLKKANANLAVANKLTPHYEAFILDKNKIYWRVGSKEMLVSRLIKVLSIDS